MLVCALGDLVLDVVVRLESGIADGDDTPASVRVTAGGQAANVAAWAAALGAEARLITRRGDDGASRLAEDEVAARGVELVGPVVSAAAGVVVSVVLGGERSMLTDRGPSPGLRAEDLDGAWLTGCDVLHVSGYALFTEPMAQAALLAAALARDGGAQVTLDLASARGISDAGGDRVRELSPEIVFAGEPELAALGREPPVETLVVKRGASGVTVVSGGRREEHAALPAEVVDPTGAGDAFAAGFLVGGVKLGLRAAARCVSTAGAMP